MGHHTRMGTIQQRGYRHWSLLLGYQGNAMFNNVCSPYNKRIQLYFTGHWTAVVLAFYWWGDWPVKLILNTYGAFLGTRVFAPFYPLVLPVITGCLRAKSVPETHYYRHGFPFLTPDSNQRVISRFLKSLMSWYWVDEMNYKICKQIKDVISFHRTNFKY